MRTEQEIRERLDATLTMRKHSNRSNNINNAIEDAEISILEWIFGEYYDFNGALLRSAKRKEPAPLPENRSNTIDSNHQHWVKQLEEQGTFILMPKGDPSGTIYGYIMTDKPPKRAGAIFQDKDGTFGLFGDMGALHITGLKWEDLGLCDAKCRYEWMNEKRKEKI